MDTHKKWWLYLRNVESYRKFIDDLIRTGWMVAKGDSWVWAKSNSVKSKEILQQCKLRWNLRAPIDYRLLDMPRGSFDTEPVMLGAINSPSTITFSVDLSYGNDVIKKRFASLLKSAKKGIAKSEYPQISQLQRTSRIYELMTLDPRKMKLKAAFQMACEDLKNHLTFDRKNLNRQLKSYALNLKEARYFDVVRHFSAELARRPRRRSYSKKSNSDFLKELNKI